MKENNNIIWYYKLKYKNQLKIQNTKIILITVITITLTKQLTIEIITTSIIIIIIIIIMKGKLNIVIGILTAPIL